VVTAKPTKEAGRASFKANVIIADGKVTKLMPAGRRRRTRMKDPSGSKAKAMEKLGLRQPMEAPRRLNSCFVAMTFRYLRTLTYCLILMSRLPTLVLLCTQRRISMGSMT
jgi:hypothetical protein